MRVGIYDPYLDDLGGGEKYMMTIASSLSKNHDVFIFWNKSKEISKISKRFNLDLTKVKLYENIFSKPNFLRKISLTKKFDSIIVLSDGSIPLTFSDLYLHIQQPIIGNFKSNFKERIKIKRVKKFFVNSYFTKSYIDKSYGVDSLVIYPPVEVKKNNTKKENLIINVGKYRQIGKTVLKKQDFMVKVFKEMVDNGLKNWSLILVTGSRPEYREQFKKLKGSVKGYPIRIVEDAENEEIWNLYSRSKVYWHASGFGEDLERHPEYAEHFGISTVEAMGAGCVPVVINAGGQKEIVEDGVDGLLWNNKTEFKKQTRRVLEDEELMMKLSKNAEKKAKNFSLNEFNKNIESLLR